MATQQNVIKAKSETNQFAATRSKYGNEVAELLEEDVNNDWEFLETFKQGIDIDD